MAGLTLQQRIAEQIAQSTPPGGDVQFRTRMAMHRLMTTTYARPAPIARDTLPECAWEDATSFIYIGTAHAITVDRNVIPLTHGGNVSLEIARALHDVGLEVVPINPEMASASALVSDPEETPPETTTPAEDAPPESPPEEDERTSAPVPSKRQQRRAEARAGA